MPACLPDHISQIRSGEGERSILIIDGRDRRVQSPFQGWLLDEVLTNALHGLHQCPLGQAPGQVSIQWVPHEPVHDQDDGWCQGHHLCLDDIVCKCALHVLGGMR